VWVLQDSAAVSGRTVASLQARLARAVLDDGRDRVKINSKTIIFFYCMGTDNKRKLSA
jgi:hypothetical protein